MLQSAMGLFLFIVIVLNSLALAQDSESADTAVFTPVEAASEVKQGSGGPKSKTTENKKSSLKKKSSRRSKKVRAQVAIVEVEGAAVYQFPNFDSPVFEYLRAGTKVMASLQPKTGIGGFGAFYRVRLPNKKLGWMADVDLLPQYKDDPRTQKKQEVNPEYEELQEQAKMANREPIYFEKYVGPGMGMVQFTEKFDGGELSSDVMMFGFRSMGPGVLFDGPPMDFSLMFSVQAPDHYTKFANGPATGFFLMSDMLMPFPIIEGRSGMLTIGFGPMITYTNFQVSVRNSNFDSQEIRLGIVGGAGYMYRFSKFAIRLDTKYYHERTAYLGAHLTFLFFRK